MSLKDRIREDRSRVFLQTAHFAETHSWNGIPFLCVVDEDEALKRKNNNVIDISWDNNTKDTMVYCKREEFPAARIIPNDHGIFDGKPMRIMQVNEDMGMVAIVLATYSTKELV